MRKKWLGLKLLQNCGWPIPLHGTYKWMGLFIAKSEKTDSLQDIKETNRTQAKLLIIYRDQ